MHTGRCRIGELTELPSELVPKIESLAERIIATCRRNVRRTEKACSSGVGAVRDEDGVALAGANVVGAEPEVVEAVFAGLVGLETCAEIVLLRGVERGMLGEGDG